MLGLSQHLFAEQRFWFSNDIKKSVFSAEEEPRVGVGWGGQSGERAAKERGGKGQDEEH